MLYILIFLIFLFFAGKYDTIITRSKSENQCILISCIILILLAGLRYRVGVDTLFYTNEYLSFKPLHLLTHDDLYNNSRYRPGWILFTSFFKTIGANIYIYQLCIAIIINISIVNFLKRKVNYVFSAILVYYVVCYIFLNTEVVREAISISIFLYAYLQLEKGKMLKYILLCILAYSFHESAFVMLFVPFVIKLKVSKIFAPLSVLIVILFAFAPVIRQYFYAYFSMFDLFAAKTEIYYSDLDSTRYTFDVSFLLNILLNVLLPLYVIFINRFNEKMNGFYMMAILSILLYSISYYIPMIYRIRYFFWLFDAVLFVDLFKMFANNKQFIYTLFLVAFLLFKSRIYFLSNDQTPVYVRYYPYTSIFNEEIIQERELLKWN